MNEHLFLKQLRLQLRGLSIDEIEEIIGEYRSYFEDAQQSGLTEEETAKNLGHPFDIAQDIKASQNQPPRSSDAIEFSSTRSIIMMIALILFNLIVVLGPALGIIGGFFAIVFTCGMFVVLPLIFFMNILFGSGHLFELFLSFVLCGAGILIFPFLLSLMKKGKYYLNQYVSWNVRLVKGEVV